MGSELVCLDQLVVRHPSAPAGRRVLDRVDLQLAAGERVAVIGASGSGKTSLLLAIALALRPEAGQLRLFGTEPWGLPRQRLPALRRRLFLAPQVPPLPPRQRVVTAVLAALLPQERLAASLRMLWSPHARDIAAAHAALAQVDMAQHLWARVDRLSGGERQRVGLARALLADAELLLIDEPLSALDPARAAQAIDALCARAQATGATLVATLHQVPVALGRFSRIVGLAHGRVVFDAAPSAVDAAALHRLYADGGLPIHDARADPPAMADMADMADLADLADLADGAFPASAIHPLQRPFR